MSRAALPAVLFGFLALMLATALACDRWITWPRVKDKIRSEFPGVRQVDSHELQGLLAGPEHRRPLLLDVRRGEEYAVSHLGGALQIDPDLSEPEALLAALGEGTTPSTPIVLYCSVGYRSSRMAERLMVLGFEDVASLEGSIFEWANRGLPLARGEESVAVVHPYDARWGRLLDRRYHAPLDARVTP